MLPGKPHQKFSRKTFDEKRIAFRLLVQSSGPETPVNSISRVAVLRRLQGQGQGQATTRSGHAANKDRKNLVAAWNWGLKPFGFMVLDTLRPAYWWLLGYL